MVADPGLALCTLMDEALRAGGACLACGTWATAVAAG
jgi:hypothetical protein